MHSSNRGDRQLKWLIPMHLAAGAGGYLLWAPVSLLLAGFLPHALMTVFAVLSFVIPVGLFAALTLISLAGMDGDNMEGDLAD